jgi:Sec-independent protein secretion pathway component TatC
MLLELVPLLLLFEVSIWVARGVERGRAIDATAPSEA